MEFRPCAMLWNERALQFEILKDNVILGYVIISIELLGASKNLRDFVAAEAKPYIELKERTNDQQKTSNPVARNERP